VRRLGFTAGPKVGATNQRRHVGSRGSSVLRAFGLTRGEPHPGHNGRLLMQQTSDSRPFAPQAWCCYRARPSLSDGALPRQPPAEMTAIGRVGAAPVRRARQPCSTTTNAPASSRAHVPGHNRRTHPAEIACGCPPCLLTRRCTAGCKRSARLAWCSTAGRASTAVPATSSRVQDELRRSAGHRGGLLHP
jgi:hypothetical protein